MLQSKQSVNPKFLGKAFRKICGKGHTGIFQVFTEKNEVLSFDIKEGRVVSVRCKTEENKEALREAGLIKKSKYTFYERKKVTESFFEDEIPTNEEVLAYLLGQSNAPAGTTLKTNAKGFSYLEN